MHMSKLTGAVMSRWLRPRGVGGAVMSCRDQVSAEVELHEDVLLN